MAHLLSFILLVPVPVRQLFLCNPLGHHSSAVKSNTWQTFSQKTRWRQIKRNKVGILGISLKTGTKWKNAR